MSPQPQQFPSEQDLVRISTLQKYNKLYENEAMAVLGLHDVISKQFKNWSDIIYISHAIPARISEFYGDFVQGDVSRMEIHTEGEDAQTLLDEIVEANDLKESIYDFAMSQSSYGYTVLLGYVEDDMFFINEIPEDQYFPQKDGSVVLATYKKDPEDSEGKKLLLYTQHYHVENGNVVIDRAAWRVDDSGVIDEPYSLERMAQIIGTPIVPQETIENLDEIPIRVINNGRGRGFGKSDYHDIVPQLSEINERVSHIATQLLKNLDAKMQLPESMFDEEGRLAHFEAIAMGKDEVEPKYIINTNPMLEETREHILFQLKMVSFISGVPMFELLKTSMPERVESLRIQLFNAVRKTDTKRAKIKRGVQDMLQIGFKMLQGNSDVRVAIEFSDVLPVDELVQVQIEAEKVRSGLSSKVSSIQRLENYTEEEALEELRQIVSDNQAAGLNNGEPPQL